MKCSIFVLGLVFLAVGGGCADRMYTKLEPGAERIKVTQNCNVVEGMELLKSQTDSVDSTFVKVKNLDIYARNFTHQAGGDVALLNYKLGDSTETVHYCIGGYWKVPYHFTVEAYRTRKISRK